MSVRKRSWVTGKGEAKEAWIVDYFDGAGKRRLKTFAKKKAADSFAAQAHVEVRDGVHVADSASITVAQAGKLWIETAEQNGCERTTTEQYRQHVDLHIVPFVGSLRLTALSVPTLRQLEGDLLKAGRSQALVRKVMTSVGSLLGDALERGLVARNVAREMARRRGPRQTRAEKRAKGKLRVGVDIPTPGEVRDIVGALVGRHRASLLVAIFGGLRASEIRGLVWPAINLTVGKVRIFQRADRFGEIGKPKSEAGDREVSLPPIAVNALREWKLAGEASDMGLVFPALDGGPQAHRTIADAFMAAQVRAGITVDTGKHDADGKAIVRAKYTGLHSLRHFYASWLINPKSSGGLGLTPKAVQERLGHASIRITMDTYGHLFPVEDDAEELAAAEQLLMAVR